MFLLVSHWLVPRGFRPSHPQLWFPLLLFLWAQLLILFLMLSVRVYLLKLMNLMKNIFYFSIFSIFESGKVSLNHPSITLAAQLLLVSVNQPWVQAGTQGLAGASSPAAQWMKWGPGCSGDSCSNLPAAPLCPCWFFAMAEIGKLLSRAQCQSQKIWEAVGNHDILLVKIHAFVHEALKTSWWV